MADSMSLAPDPRRGHATSPRTLNRWACCFGDPVNLVDVDGGWPDVGKWMGDRANDVGKWWNDHAATSVTTTTIPGSCMGSWWGITPSQTKTVSTGGDRWLYTNITDGKVTGGGIRIPGVVSIGWNNGLTVSLGGGNYGGYTVGISAKLGMGQYGLSLDLDAQGGKSDNNWGLGVSAGIPQSGVRLSHNTTDDNGVVTHDQTDAHVNTALAAAIVVISVFGGEIVEALIAAGAGGLAGAGAGAGGLIFAMIPSFSSTCG